MNRIQQGRVKRAETSNGKDAAGQSQGPLKPRRSAWRGHELFQDAAGSEKKNQLAKATRT
jgi:hypothetical protein